MIVRHFFVRQFYWLERLVFFRCQLRRVLFQILCDCNLEDFVGCVGFGGLCYGTRFQGNRLLCNLGQLIRTQVGIRLQRLQQPRGAHYPRARQQNFYDRARPQHRKLVKRLFLYRRILRECGQQTRPQILERNEIAQDLGAGRWIGSGGQTGFFIPTGQRETRLITPQFVMERQVDQNLNRLPRRHRQGSARRELHQVRWSLRIADQIKHSGHHSSPRICRGFLLRHLASQLFPTIAVSGPPPAPIRRLRAQARAQCGSGSGADIHRSRRDSTRACLLFFPRTVSRWLPHAAGNPPELSGHYAACPTPKPAVSRRRRASLGPDNLSSAPSTPASARRMNPCNPPRSSPPADQTACGFRAALACRRNLRPHHAAAPRSPYLRRRRLPALAMPPPSDATDKAPPFASASALHVSPRHIGKRAAGGAQVSAASGKSSFSLS